MDVAIVLDHAGDRNLRASVQLVPDPGLPTQESGTRHRTAERVARQTGLPVITVSKSMRTIAMFSSGERYVLEDSAALLTRAHQALATLERYKRRLDDSTGALSAMEIEDRATVGDISVVAQRLEMVSRVTNEIGGYLVELGTDGGLLGLQLEELTAGTTRERELLLRDYAPDSPTRPETADAATAAGATASGTAMAGAASAGDGAAGQPAPVGADLLARLSPDELLDLPAVAAAVGLDAAAGLEQHVTARGYRLLGQIPRLPQATADSLIEYLGGLQKLLSASAQDLRRVHGLDAAQATRVREGLSRLAESALMERYP